MKDWKSICILIVVFTVSVAAVAIGSGGLTMTPKNIVNQTSTQPAIQQCVLNGTVAQKTVSTNKGFVNYTTTDTTCMKVTAYTGGTALPVPVAIKVRIGGFATGAESDFFVLPATNDNIIWPGVTATGAKVTKVGFQPYSSGSFSATRISGAKMAF